MSNPVMQGKLAEITYTIRDRGGELLEHHPFAGRHLVYAVRVVDVREPDGTAPLGAPAGGVLH